MRIGLSSLPGTDGRRLLPVLAALVILALIVAAALFYVSGYARVKRLSAIKLLEHGEFLSLKREFLLKKKAIAPILRKAYVSGEGASTIAVVEEIGGMVGVKEKITALKPLGETKEMGFAVSGVELRIEGIELNQLVNLLYLIENHKTLLVIKDFTLKSRFEDPDLLDVSLKLKRLTRSGA
jgi:general secretion pathway protein M